MKIQVQCSYYKLINLKNCGLNSGTSNMGNQDCKTIRRNYRQVSNISSKHLSNICMKTNRKLTAITR